MNEEQFRELVQSRLIDSKQVQEMLGLADWASVNHRVERGWLSGPVLVKGRGYSLWDREQVEREEAKRVAAVRASADGRVRRSLIPA